MIVFFVEGGWCAMRKDVSAVGEVTMMSLLKLLVWDLRHIKVISCCLWWRIVWAVNKFINVWGRVWSRCRCFACVLHCSCLGNYNYHNWIIIIIINIICHGYAAYDEAKSPHSLRSQILQIHKTLNLVFYFLLWHTSAIKIRSLNLKTKKFLNNYYLTWDGTGIIWCFRWVYALGIVYYILETWDWDLCTENVN